MTMDTEFNDCTGTCTPFPDGCHAPPLLYTATLGCKINQYETQALKEAWLARGWKDTDCPEKARAIIINSCAVTARAVRDTRKLVRRMSEKALDAEIIVTGCAAQAFSSEFREMPEISRVVPQKNKYSLAPCIGKNNLSLQITDYFRARAPIRIQDGCTHGCTYCIVPHTRGKSVSCPPDRILREIRDLFKAGVREISLCGINLRQYGRDLDPAIDFWDVLQMLSDSLSPEWAGRARIRLSSLEPSELNRKALYTISSCTEMLCPHLHISLQSASKRVLKQMGRGHYNPESLMDFTRKLHWTWPRFALGTDLLTGFPGETAEMHERTKELINLLPFSYAHIFPYSPRPGTRAADFPDQVSQEKKKLRSRELKEIMELKKERFRKDLLDLPRLHPVMENNDGGTNEFFVPTQIKESRSGAERRKIIPVRPLQVKNGTILAEPAK